MQEASTRHLPPRPTAAAARDLDLSDCRKTGHNASGVRLLGPVATVQWLGASLPLNGRTGKQPRLAYFAREEMCCCFKCHADFLGSA